MQIRRTAQAKITLAEANAARDQAANAWASHKANCYPCWSATGERPTWCKAGWDLVKDLREAASASVWAASTEDAGTLQLW